MKPDGLTFVNLKNYPDLVPDLWVDTLNIIREFFDEAYIVGGALRDRYYGKEVKDIDVFVWNEHSDSKMKKLVKALNCKRKSLDKLADEYDHVDIDRVIELQVEGIELPIQLVFVKPEGSRKSITDFDLSFCQIGTNGSHLFYSKQFSDTTNTKIVTITRKPIEDWEYARLHDRINKFRLKFPDFKFPEVYNEITL